MGVSWGFSTCALEKGEDGPGREEATNREVETEREAGSTSCPCPFHPLSVLPPPASQAPSQKKNGQCEGPRKWSERGERGGVRKRTFLSFSFCSTAPSLIQSSSSPTNALDPSSSSEKPEYLVLNFPIRPNSSWRSREAVRLGYQSGWLDRSLVSL